MDARELEKKIIKCSEDYYRGLPTISDDEFDKLVEELKAIDPESKVLGLVGWGYNPSKYGQTVKHYAECKGISDKRRVLPDHIIDLNDTLIATPKFDGSSVELIYEDGILSKAITRGDGVEGFDVTEKLKYIVPISIPLKNTVSVQGEYLADISKYNEDDAVRNIASGFLNRKDVTEDECRDFIFIAYTLNSDSDTYKKADMLYTLDLLGFDSAFYTIHTSISYKELMEQYVEHYEGKVLMDGIVINSLNDNSVYCYKVDNERAKVKVTSISYQLTMRGRVTPVVNYEPVILSRAVLSRATAHNMRFIYDNNIGIGTELEIIRSGEVIPYISDIIKPTEAVKLTHCPVCGSILEFDGTHERCVNLLCDYKLKYRLINFILYFSPKGLASTSVERFIEENNISNIAELKEAASGKKLRQGGGR